MAEKRKSIGAGKVSQVPNKRLRLEIGSKAVKTEHLADGAVTPKKISSDFAEYVTADVQNQIDSIQIGGWAISNKFGNDVHIGISQKTITDAFNMVWEELEEIVGHPLRGFNMVVIPGYFVSEEGTTTVHISATPIKTGNIFEKISLYSNDVLVTESEYVSSFEYDVEITDTTVFRCEGKIMGIDYEQQKTVTHYNSFWLGGGDSYEDVMDAGHLIPITEGLRGAYDIDVLSGQHIIIVLGDALREEFIRADMSGFEIPFTESSVTVSDKGYKVLVSDNTYQAGTYNIDING